jgi:DNA-binding Xre family transcriptional regulator
MAKWTKLLPERQKNLSLKTLNRVAKALGVKVEELFQFE